MEAVTDKGYMKNKLSIFFIFAGFSLLLACSDIQPVKLRYEAEKKFHLAEKQYNDAQVKNELTNPAVNNSIKTSYHDIFIFCFKAIDLVNRDTNPKEFEEFCVISYQSATRLTQLLFNDRQFDSCVTVLNQLSAKIPIPVSESAALKVNLGQALQASGRWNEAIQSYNQAVGMLNPPSDKDGRVNWNVFNLPAHIFWITYQLEDSLSAEREYQKAISYYQGFIRSYPGSPLALASHTNLASLHADKHNWPAVVSELRQVTDSNGNVVMDARIRIADIFAGELGQFDSAMNIYETIASGLTNQDTLLRPTLIFKRSLVLMEMKQYDKTRELLNTLNREYEYYYANYPAPQNVKAKCFELEGKWDRAETEYQFLIDNYFGSDEAMAAYMYVADQLAKRGRKVESDRMFEKADVYYQQIANRNQGNQTEALALSYRAELMQRNNDLRGAATMLGSIFQKFPETDIGQRAARLAINLYRQKLNDPVSADSLISTIRKILIPSGASDQKIGSSQ